MFQVDHSISDNLTYLQFKNGIFVLSVSVMVSFTCLCIIAHIYDWLIIS